MGLPLAIPIAMAAASALKGGADVVGGKKAQRAEDKRRADAQARLDAFGQEYGDFQKMLAGAFGLNPETYQPFATGLASQMLAPQIQTREGSSTSFTRPEIAKEYKPGENLVYGKLLQRVQRGSSLPPGYAETQAANISAGYAPELQREKNRAAKLGLSGPDALLGSSADAARIRDINTMRAALPLEERKMGIENEQFLQGYLEKLRGTRQKQSYFDKSTGPADYGGYMGLLGALAPREPTVVT